MTQISTLLNQPFVIASDHGGYALKQHLLAVLAQKKISHFKDLGSFNDAMVNFPDYAGQVAKAIQNGDAAWGILICGTGIGMSIAANRHKGIYAAPCHDVTTTRLVRQHNNANILTLGGRMIGLILAEEILETFMNTAFLGGRYEDRIGMIESAC